MTYPRSSLALGILFLPVVFAGCWHGKTGQTDNQNSTNLNAGMVNEQVNGQVSMNAQGNTNESANSDGSSNAFFYQTVGAMVNGVGLNAVMLGQTTDGFEVDSLGQTAVEWSISKDVKMNAYGDPVFSRLSNGNWAMTSWSHQDDTRGPGRLLYHESACPVVDDAQVIAIEPSTAEGCQPVRSLTNGKTSQIFEAEGGNFVFHMIFGEIYLAHLSDVTHSASELESLCVLDTPVSSLSELDYGESTLVLDKDDSGLLLSDTAMGRRADGTWVLFVKGIPPDNGCEPNSVCELCARSIWRTTSTDLIHWTDLEEVVEQASVPEATTNDGTVWLYWQNFSQVCETENQVLGNNAPISGAYELPGTYNLSEPGTVSFPDEEFQTNSQLHYATNGNPVALPDAEARAAFAACFESN